MIKRIRQWFELKTVKITRQETLGSVHLVWASGRIRDTDDRLVPHGIIVQHVETEEILANYAIPTESEAEEAWYLLLGAFTPEVPFVGGLTHEEWRARMNYATENPTTEYR